jgi:hypothetical protein
MTSQETSRGVVAALRWGSGSGDDSDHRRFQQRRVALLARLLLIFFGTITVASFGIIGVARPRQLFEIQFHPAKLSLYLVMLVWAAIWVALRRDRPLRVVYLCDLGTILPLCVFLGLAVQRAPLAINVQAASVFLALLMLVLRAALVPSQPAWTAALGLLCGPVVVWSEYRRAVEVPGGIPPALLAAGAVLWWLVVTAATTFVSRTIYGLVTEASQARRLGQYTLMDKIGEGGMGEVYRAQHALLRRPTAVKLLLAGRHGAEALRRFEREVQLTSRLSHPNTIAIYDYGRTPDGVFYYAMEYLDGLNLERLVASDGPQPAGRVIHLLAQVAEALSEAHGVGLIHRDIKPANIMVCERGGIPDMAKVLDFGLVKQLDAARESGDLTTATEITGTPLYLSPEAIAGATLDGRADLYALGAVGYFLLTGTPPFSARTVVEICAHHLHTVPVSPSQRLGAAVPPRLEALILRCLAKTAAERPPDAAGLEALLVECQREAPWTRGEARAWWTGRRDAARAV